MLFIVVFKYVQYFAIHTISCFKQNHDLREKIECISSTYNSRRAWGNISKLINEPVILTKTTAFLTLAIEKSVISK